MKDFLLQIEGGILVGCMFILAVIVVSVALSEIVQGWRIWRGKRKVAAMSLLAAAAMIVGGTKGPVSRVNFPRTDPEVAYLIDAGSYVSNSFVHVDFSTFLIPSSAMIELAYWPNESTNEDEFVVLFSDALAAWPRPLDFEFEDASSNRWYCYTTWTPGPVVHTNGVWQQDWMMGVTNKAVIVPVRTSVIEDGKRIMPPTNERTQE